MMQLADDEDCMSDVLCAPLSASLECVAWLGWRTQALLHIYSADELWLDSAVAVA